MTFPTPVKEKVESLPLQPEGFSSLFGNGNFMALWLGQLFSQLGDRVVFVVFIATIVQYFGTSDSYNSYLYIAFTIPAILLTAVAGVFIDRWPRRAVLVSTNVFRAVFVACLPLAVGHLMGIYALAFFLSVATQFFIPAEAATIPMVVRKTQLIAANSLFTTTMMASVIFGFALGDPLINIFSLEGVHWAIVGLFALASLTLLFVKAPPPIRTTEDFAPGRTISQAVDAFFAELGEGVSYIRGNQLLLNAMLKLALLFSTVVALCILFISFAKEFLYDDPQVAARKFAYIITVSGIGMAMGAPLVGRLAMTFRRGPLVFSGFAIVGFCLLVLGLIGSIAKTDHVFQLPAIKLDFLYLDPIHFTLRMAYTYVFTLIMGIAAAFVAIPLQALIHEIIPEDKRGKILGVQFTILSTCSTVPVLIAGLGVEQIGTRWMFVMIAIPLLLIGLAGLWNRTPLESRT